MGEASGTPAKRSSIETATDASAIDAAAMSKPAATDRAGGSEMARSIGPMVRPSDRHGRPGAASHDP